MDEKTKEIYENGRKVLEKTLGEFSYNPLIEKLAKEFLAKLNFSVEKRIESEEMPANLDWVMGVMFAEQFFAALLTTQFGKKTLETTKRTGLPARKPLREIPNYLRIVK